MNISYSAFKNNKLISKINPKTKDKRGQYG